MTASKSSSFNILEHFCIFSCKQLLLHSKASSATTITILTRKSRNIESLTKKQPTNKCNDYSGDRIMNKNPRVAIEVVFFEDRCSPMADSLIYFEVHHGGRFNRQNGCLYKSGLRTCLTLMATNLETLSTTRSLENISIGILADILAAFMGMQRPIGAYLAMEMQNKRDAEDISYTFMGRDIMVVGPCELSVEGAALSDLEASIATSRIRHVRARMHGLALKNVRIAGKLSVHIPDGCTDGDVKASLILFSYIVSLMRSYFLFDVVNWSKVYVEVKSYIMNKVLDDFNMDYDWPKDRNTLMSIINTAYRMHWYRMHRYYALFPIKEEVLEHPYSNMKTEEWVPICELFSAEEFHICILRRSEINHQNRAKLTVAHTSGACSFQCALVLMEKVEVLQLQQVPEGRSFTKVEIFTEALGMKVGYVHGLGRSVRQVGSSSSTLSIYLARRLEEARVEMEEKRVRQNEYDEVVVKRVEMERVMREQ
ncbi:hypothetical protein CJ030_MR2G018728 [Morella rubra]|uniref:Uncharacterized protein n=1 Tax=Morella rubra TaxID=262757 RepID=A0A6A1WCU9_9ROSI|nr:hypothetical protein CJ030_MR2G018728 [Morella rubra]